MQLKASIDSPIALLMDETLSFYPSFVKCDPYKDRVKLLGAARYRDYKGAK
ncbi:MAG: hypothetical protein ACTSU2_08845 [Promethearchaeota archaeon]